jgi:hypothetical protein
MTERNGREAWPPECAFTGRYAIGQQRHHMNVR